MLTNYIQIKDPIAVLIEQFTKSIIHNFNNIGEKARNFISYLNSQDPHFEKTLTDSSFGKHSNYYKIEKFNQYPSSANNYQTHNYDGIMEANNTYMKDNRQKRNLREEDEPMMLKKPRNAYNLFVQSQSIKIKENNPHMRAPDIIRIAAERYNTMSQQQKRPYVQKFEEAKRIYENQQMSQVNKQTSLLPRKGRGSRGARYDYTLK